MNFISIKDFLDLQLKEIFLIADDEKIENTDFQDKTAILFFPETSIRTRITFEKGINELGGKAIIFPSDSLNKKEELIDVIGYIENWADLVIIRHPEISKINKIVENANIPIINAMTNYNHPCEILSDMYGIRKRNFNYQSLKYVFVGPKGNILNSWINIAEILNLEFIHVADENERMKYDSKNYKLSSSIEKVLPETDVLLTDSLTESFRTESYYRKYQITKDRLELLPDNTIINPCPPFFRGEEISSEVIESKKFVGYDFKKELLNVQKAIIKYCIRN